MTGKTLAALLGLLAVGGALAADNDTVQEVLDESGELVDVLPDDLVDDATGVLDDRADTPLDAIGDWFGRAFAAVGDAARAVGAAVADTARALTSVAALVAIGAGSATLLFADGLGAVAATVGGTAATAVVVIGQATGAAGAWLGTGVAGLAGLYASLVGAMRPDAMPPVAFGAVVASGAAGSAGVGGWAGWNVLRKWGWVASGAAGIPGFTRIADDELLEHPVRGDIFTMIRTNPGIHASQLARELGVGWGTISHHLDKLQKGHVVTTRKVNNQKCYFEQGGTVSRIDMEVASAVKGDTAGSIARFVHGHPMASQKQVAEALDISPALASFHVRKLVHLGVLDKMRHGRETLLTTSHAMRRLLESDRNVAAAFAARQEDSLDYSA